jgi:hypothetical protein
VDYYKGKTHLELFYLSIFSFGKKQDCFKIYQNEHSTPCPIAGGGPTAVAPSGLYCAVRVGPF